MTGWRTRGLCLVAAGALIVLVAACTGSSGSSGPPSAGRSGAAGSGGSAASPGQIGPALSGSGSGGSDGAAALAEGECLDSGSFAAFDWTAAAVSCDQPHTVEVFGVLEVSSEFPTASYASITDDNGDQRNGFVGLTQQACTAKLSAYSGGAALLPKDASPTASVVPYFYGAYNAAPVPAASWNAGDKRVACYATFGAHGSDEGDIKVSGNFLKTFWTAPATNLDARFCQVTLTVSSVSCADAHDQEYLGQYFAQDYSTRAGFDTKTLKAFDVATATDAQWAPYDQLCEQEFGALLGSGTRTDVGIVATTDTSAEYWGLDGSYAFQCVASPQVGYVKGSLIGIGDSPLPTAPTPSPSTS
jgi:hypothetical protein